jgi:uncharacterized small protein (DUF1192 family)
MNRDNIDELFEEFFCNYSECEVYIFLNHCKSFAMRCVEITTASMQEEIDRLKAANEFSCEISDSLKADDREWRKLVDEQDAQIAELQAEVEALKAGIEFHFKHTETGEIVTRTMSMSEARDYLDDNAYDLLTCDCQPVGETNVVECNCEGYFEMFEIIEPPKAGE